MHTFSNRWHDNMHRLCSSPPKSEQNRFGKEDGMAIKALNNFYTPSNSALQFESKSRGKLPCGIGLSFGLNGIHI